MGQDLYRWEGRFRMTETRADNFMETAEDRGGLGWGVERWGDGGQGGSEFSLL